MTGAVMDDRSHHVRSELGCAIEARKCDQS
jgi:hypothetical protein